MTPAQIIAKAQMLQREPIGMDNYGIIVNAVFDLIIALARLQIKNSPQAKKPGG